MAQNSQPQLPIGYWLKQADNLLTEQANKAQAAHDLSRFDWQVFNLLHEKGKVRKAEIFEVMRTFNDAASLERSLSALVERG